FDQAAPGRGRVDDVVALRERRRGRSVCGRSTGIVHVDIQHLRAERAAERGRQVAHLDTERDQAVGAAVDDLEALDVERARVEIARGRISVVAGAVVVTAGIGYVEQNRAGHEVEFHGAGGVRGAAARADGNHVQ